MTYVSLLVGFILLIKGADYFVEGSSAVARKFHIPSMVIGMTLWPWEPPCRNVRSV